MKKQIHTFFDRVNNCNDSVILLRHIAKSKELASRVISKIDVPLSAAECDIKVGRA